MDPRFDGFVRVVGDDGSRRARRYARIFEILDEMLESIRATVEHEIVAEIAFARIEFAVRRDLFGMHECHIEPGVHAVMQHD